MICQCTSRQNLACHGVTNLMTTTKKKKLCIYSCPLGQLTRQCTHMYRFHCRWKSFGLEFWTGDNQIDSYAHKLACSNNELQWMVAIANIFSSCVQRDIKGKYDGCSPNAHGWLVCEIGYIFHTYYCGPL